MESAYQKRLYYEIKQAGLKVQKEKPMPTVYKKVKLDHGYSIVVIFEEKVAAEIKIVEAFSDLHIAQVLTCLRLGNYKLGLLFNFQTTVLKNGLKREIN